MTIQPDADLCLVYCTTTNSAQTTRYVRTRRRTQTKENDLHTKGQGSLPDADAKSRHVQNRTRTSPYKVKAPLNRIRQHPSPPSTHLASIRWCTVHRGSNPLASPNNNPHDTRHPCLCLINKPLIIFNDCLVVVVDSHIQRIVLATCKYCRNNGDITSQPYCLKKNLKASRCSELCCHHLYSGHVRYYKELKTFWESVVLRKYRMVD